MKMEKSIDSLLEMVKGFSEREQAELAERIMKMLAETPAAKKGQCRDLITENKPERPDCPHCAAKAALGYIENSAFL